MEMLTDLQKLAMQLFFAVPDLKRYFYLTGGTALAGFYLHHRYSDDLDFFTHSIEIASIERVVEDCWVAGKLSVVKERSSPTYRRYRLNGELQIDIVRDVDMRVGAPQLHGICLVDDPKNIAVNKITAIYGRLDAKDYVDLRLLLTRYEYDFFELFRHAQQKDAGLELFQWAKIIADVDTFTVLPRMIDPVAPSELQKFFHVLRKEIVSHLKAETR
ncbi:MAG: nucleotidyl transferase AbiEii/AbiGii toxin family protein [Deltaproteobacteria bacterium]|nr:nucleotidyl transferase AbiEii/AbiGii toxin family protein [Deltaproteobacteria bacterium]